MSFSTFADSCMGLKIYRALYETYKRQWLSITPDQESHFSKFKENRHRIGTILFSVSVVLQEFFFSFFCLHLWRLISCISRGFLLLPLFRKGCFANRPHAPCVCGREWTVIVSPARYTAHVHILQL
jgi:hypothetical protein